MLLVGVTDHMRNIAILAFLTTTCLADAMTVTQVVDQASGVSALVYTLPSAENCGFSLLDGPSKKDGDTIKEHWDPTNHLVMVNGGYFNSDFSPTGLCRVEGRTLSGGASPKLSGFVGIDKAGKVHILTQQDDVMDYPTLLQAGPFVIDPGGLIGIRSRSGAQARRTLVGLTKVGDLVIIVTEPVYLLDFSRFVAKRFPSIDRLINLDGGPSTALMSGNYTVLNQWPVRNYLVKKRETPTTPPTVPDSAR